MIYLISAALIIVLILTGVYQCPLKELAGIPCPFCGMTRAFISLLKFNMSDAFYYHPLWPVLPVLLLIILLKKTDVIKLSSKAVDAGLILTGVMFLICFVIRHIYGSPVVSINTEGSVLGQLFTK